MGVIQKIKNLLKYRESVSTYLDFMSDTENPYWGSISDKEIEILKSLTLNANELPGPIIEFGALFGLSSQIIASHKKPSKKFYVIENYIWNPFGISKAEHQMFLRRNLYDCCLNRNTELIEMDNTQFYHSYQGETPAFIFIDADHSYEGVSQDIKWALSQNISIISGHDFKDDHPGVKKAVEENFHGNYKVKETLWIARRK